MKKLLIILLFFLLFSCSKNTQYVGTTSETTNGSIAGIVNLGDDIAANIYLYSLSTSELLFTKTDENGAFSFDDLNISNYVMTIIAESQKLGKVDNIDLSQTSDLEIDNIDLDTMNSLYLISSEILAEEISGVYFPNLGIKLNNISQVNGDTIFLANLPASQLDQILLEINNDYKPLLVEPIVLIHNDSIYIHDELTKESMLAYGYYSYSYVDTLNYDSIEVNTYEELELAVKDTNNLVILINNSIQGIEMLDVNSNKILIGQSASVVIDGFGVRISNQRNVKIKNLIFENSIEDAIEIDNSTRVWVDHCEFLSAFDELVSVIKGSDSISISWSLFENNKNALLIGANDSDTITDENKLHVTLYNNLFRGTTEQNPRVRFGTVDLINNLWINIVDYGIASTMSAKVKIESNVFVNVKIPSIVSHTSSEDGFIEESNNLLINSGEIISNSVLDDMPYTMPIYSTAWVNNTILYSSGTIKKP